jgi:hypothetical protein
MMLVIFGMVRVSQLYQPVLKNIKQSVRQKLPDLVNTLSQGECSFERFGPFTKGVYDKKQFACCMP